MTVRARISDASETLTSSERKLSTTLLADYPFAGLEPIQELARRTAVSPPSISRFVTKLGFQGYQDFQRQLIAELKEGQRSPVEIMGQGRQVTGSYLEDFTERAKALLDEAAQGISQAQFQRICDLLADPSRRIFVLGGRISDLVAQHLSRHLKRLRPDVRQLDPDPETWPDALLEMRPRDVLLLVDFRRYQQTVADLKAAGVDVIELKVDIANSAALSVLLEKTDTSLRGIIHTAGVLDDGLLKDQSPERFRKVLSPKIQGT